MNGPVVLPRRLPVRLFQPILVLHLFVLPENQRRLAMRSFLQSDEHGDGARAQQRLLRLLLSHRYPIARQRRGRANRLLLLHRSTQASVVAITVTHTAGQHEILQATRQMCCRFYLSLFFSLPGEDLKAESIQLAEIEILKIRFLPGQWQEPAISASQC